MEKKITIILTSTGTILRNEGFSAIEMLGVLRFYEKNIWLEMQKQNTRQIETQKKDFFYNGTTLEMKIGDEVRVLPSSDCVTNSDTIKYDEKIDGVKAFIKFINYSENKVLLTSGFYVHETWLQFIKHKR